MSKYVELTNAAITICEANYAKNCGGCPLRPVCVRNTGPGQEALDKWTQRINEKAQELVSQ